MLFITNRFFEEGIETVLDRKISFDLKNNAPSNSIYYCRREKRGKYIEIGSSKFLHLLKKSKYEELLFYIHGFSNLPEPDIFPRSEILQDMFDKSEAKRMLVIPLIWPCDNDIGIVKDYWDDQKSADQSAFSFARILQKFMEWRNKEENKDNPCLKRLHVLAHSMGNRVYRETLKVWAKYDLPRGVPQLFRNSFLIAADVVNESLEPQNTGIHLCHSSKNVVVYFASDDLALRASKISNLKNKVASRRLGHSGPENMDKVPKNVYAIDCDAFNTEYDHPKGHTYFLADKKGKPGAVFKHIFDTVRKAVVFPDDETRRTKLMKD